MKKIILISITTLLAACAGQQPDPQQQADADLKAEARKRQVIVSPQVIPAKEAEESFAGNNQLTVTGSRVKTAVADSTALYHPMPTPYLAVPQDREKYNHFENQSIQSVLDNPISTFSIDVDTGSYANVRRMLNQGQMPRQDAVRVEEMINYFSYDYATPDNIKQPFLANAELAPSPWNAEAHLLHIGIKGYEKAASERPAANLVFLVDVSGSMNSPDKIGLLKSSLKLLYTTIAMTMLCNI